MVLVRMSYQTKRLKDAALQPKHARPLCQATREGHRLSARPNKEGLSWCQLRFFEPLSVGQVLDKFSSTTPSGGEYAPISLLLVFPWIEPLRYSLPRNQRKE